jgi:hypothetical protein
MYLSGTTNKVIEPLLLEYGVGLLSQPGTYGPDAVARFPFWAADNGCFSARWSEDPWLRWLDRLPRDNCLFAVAPDVYPDAAATLERSWPYFELIREMGYPAALVAQDGAEHLDIPWDDFDCLFIGGEKKTPARLEWKLGAEAEHLAKQARSHGLWVHMGRVNSLTRMRRAREMGCNSADGTFIAKAPNHNVPRMRVWQVWLDTNPDMFTFEGHSLPVHRDAALFMAHAAPATPPHKELVAA